MRNVISHLTLHPLQISVFHTNNEAFNYLKLWIEIYKQQRDKEGCFF